MQLDYTFERQLELEREAASEATSRAWKQGVESGMQRGLEQGEQNGREQERLTMIQKMASQGYDKPFIMQFGYTEEEYQKSMKK